MYIIYVCIITYQELATENLPIFEKDLAANIGILQKTFIITVNCKQDIKCRLLAYKKW